MTAKEPRKGTTICQLGEPYPHRFDDSGENRERCRRCGWTEGNYWHNPSLSRAEFPYEERVHEIDWSAVPFN